MTGNPASGGSVNRLLERHRWQILLVLIALAATVRLAALADFNHSIYGDFLIWDERVYHNWASALVDDSATPRPVRDFTSLPAYIMAAVYAVFSPSPIYFRYFNVFLGVLTCILIYRIGWEISGPLVATGAGVAATFYKPFIFFSITLLKSSLSIFLCAWMVLLFLRCIKKSSYPHSLALGVCAGLLTNVRANFLPVLPLLPVLIVWHRFRVERRGKSAAWLAGACLAGMALSLSPFIVKNYLETGRPALTAAGGFNLYLANNPDNSCPYYRPAPFATSNPVFQGVQFVIEASRRTGKTLGTRGASSFWTREVIRLGRENPAWLIGKLFQKAMALFSRFEPADNFDIGFLSRFIPFLAWPFLGIGLMIPLGMAGIFRAMAGKDPQAISLFLISFVYAATLVAFFTNIRIRLPLLVVWIPYAVYGLVAVIEDFFERRKKAVWLFVGTAILFSVVIWTPLPCAGDMSGHYNTHAINLMGKREGEGRHRLLEGIGGDEKAVLGICQSGLGRVL